MDEVEQSENSFNEADSKQVKIATSRQLKMQRKIELFKLLVNKSFRIVLKPNTDCPNHLALRFRKIQVDHIIDDEFVLCIECYELISSPKCRGTTRMRRHAETCTGRANATGQVIQSKDVTQFKASPVYDQQTEAHQCNFINNATVSTQTDDSSDSSRQVNQAMEFIDKDGKKFIHYVPFDNAFVYLLGETGELMLLKNHNEESSAASIDPVLDVNEQPIEIREVQSSTGVNSGMEGATLDMCDEASLIHNDDISCDG